MTNAGPEVGALAPDINGTGLDGTTVKFGGEQGRRSMLVFISPDCPACDELGPSLRALSRSERASLDILLVAIAGDETRVRAFLEKHKLGRMPCLLSGETAKQYGVLSAPYAMLVNEKGLVVSKGVVNQLEHLESLLTAAELGHASMESLLTTKYRGRDDATPEDAAGPERPYSEKGILGQT